MYICVYINYLKSSSLAFGAKLSVDVCTAVGPLCEPCEEQYLNGIWFVEHILVMPQYGTSLEFVILTVDDLWYVKKLLSCIVNLDLGWSSGVCCSFQVWSTFLSLCQTLITQDDLFLDFLTCLSVTAVCILWIRALLFSGDFQRRQACLRGNTSEEL